MALRSTENEVTLPTRARILLKNDPIAKRTTLFNKVGLYENVKTPQLRFLPLRLFQVSSHQEEQSTKKCLSLPPTPIRV
jgi:hypothetical protein